ncbi:sigma-70 family RNA polymerase sigma factor [Pseudomonas otitidis]|uniref:sigma-70 family RNA polymerase sigma factor n=1 Tax=Metapseudomonas otitidis TaxID=319939 RepID=UPI0024480ACD|nr:sigma-70 family RNA polymerase sigma factor [Pseudomonas otitidis]MDH1108456.1 sigma-70 family RNA polymerase sigma factor [Pseudomonas otitidis]MDH1160913.1 sigma-70 family RNA polymerase sigma factor [Pseudomonas otitidis]MDH1167183.1 sigma-70 family RNA polymerase sigma factor [Pseudomonas otitidis]
MDAEELITEPETEQSLWRRWLASKGAELRTQLFFFYSQWVRLLTAHLFTRYPHPLAEWHDYLNLASLGLLQAIDRFDPRLGSNFKAYAEPYIKGSVLKGLACYVKDRRTPATERLASITGAGEAEGLSDLEHVANVAIDLAFGYFLELGVLDQEPVDNNPLSLYEAEREGQDMALLISQLSPGERQVIEGHYFQQLSFTEISELMGVSRSRVSQLHAGALKKIRGKVSSVEI